jgi:hypothetical protein
MLTAEQTATLQSIEQGDQTAAAEILAESADFGQLEGMAHAASSKLDAAYANVKPARQSAELEAAKNEAVAKVAALHALCE